MNNDDDHSVHSAQSPLDLNDIVGMKHRTNRTSSDFRAEFAMKVNELDVFRRLCVLHENDHGFMQMWTCLLALTCSLHQQAARKISKPSNHVNLLNLMT